MLDAKQQIEILESLKYDVDRIHDAQLFRKENPDHLIAYVDVLLNKNMYIASLKCLTQMVENSK